MSKKPPDKYKCIKLRNNKILDSSAIYNNKNVVNTIDDAIKRTNKIVIKSYMLLRLWILKKYESSSILPNITTDTIKIAFKSVIENSKRGKRPSGNNLILLNELKELYKNEITDIFEDGTKLSTILNYYAITMLTSINNNIKNNFINYINRYVNSYFLIKYENEIKNKDFKKQLFKDLNIIKKDICENTTHCDEKYKVWLIGNRSKLVPKYETNENIYSVLKNTPQLFFKHMIYMNIELSKLNKPQFQFFPIQSNTILRHIQIDTSSLIELFENKVSEVFKHIEIQKPIIWYNLFKINKKIKNYVFDYTIITDGYSTALRFLHKDYVKIEKDKKTKMKLGNTIRNNRLKGLSKEDKELEKELIKKEKAEQNNSKSKVNVNVKANTNAKVNVNVKANAKVNVKANTNAKENTKTKENTNTKTKENTKVSENIINTTTINNCEFPYIDDIVNKKELEGKHIFIDPGKRSLFTMMDDNNKFISYTNKEHMEKTKRLKYSKKLNIYKTNLGITSIETELSGFNSKSCIVEDFKKYIKKKLEVNDKVLDLYNDNNNDNNKFIQYKWYSFINKKRAEDKLLNKIEKEYSKEHTVIIGDWSIGKQMSNFISTPNITLKRKLKERFKVYNIDEFRTSCLNYKTENKCENLILPSPITGINYKMHSILTYKMENNRLGCINRDKNGCYNIKKLFDTYMTLGNRPDRYRRGVKID